MDQSPAWMIAGKFRTFPSTVFRKTFCYIASALLRAFDAFFGFPRHGLSLSKRRMACHEQAKRGPAMSKRSAPNGYRAWIRTMNNASKGRCYIFVSHY
jgi:hypothetical protein